MPSVSDPQRGRCSTGAWASVSSGSWRPGAITAAPRRGVNPVVFGAGVWAGVIVSPRTMGSFPLSSVLLAPVRRALGRSTAASMGAGAPRRWRFCVLSSVWPRTGKRGRAGPWLLLCVGADKRWPRVLWHVPDVPRGGEKPPCIQSRPRLSGRDTLAPSRRRPARVFAPCMSR